MGKGSDMDYKAQIERAKHAAVKWREKHPIVGVGELRVDCMVDDLTRSITDLLARAEAAESSLAKYTKSELDPCDYAAMKSALDNEGKAKKDLTEALNALGGQIKRAEAAEEENARWRQVCEAQYGKIDALKILVKSVKEKSEDAMLTGYAKGVGEMTQENANLKNLLDDLLESMTPSAHPVRKDRVLVQPVSGYGGPGIHILLELNGFAADKVFVFDNGHDTTEDLCKVISSTLTDMLGEARSKNTVQNVVIESAPAGPVRMSLAEATLRGERANGS